MLRMTPSFDSDFASRALQFIYSVFPSETGFLLADFSSLRIDGTSCRAPRHGDDLCTSWATLRVVRGGNGIEYTGYSVDKFSQYQVVRDLGTALLSG